MNFKGDAIQSIIRPEYIKGICDRLSKELGLIQHLECWL